MTGGSQVNGTALCQLPEVPQARGSSGSSTGPWRCREFTPCATLHTRKALHASVGGPDQSMDCCFLKRQ